MASEEILLIGTVSINYVYGGGGGGHWHAPQDFANRGVCIPF